MLLDQAQKVFKPRPCTGQNTQGSTMSKRMDKTVSNTQLHKGEHGRKYQHKQEQVHGMNTTCKVVEWGYYSVQPQELLK